MAKLRKKEDNPKEEKKNRIETELLEDLRNSGRITARIVDAKFGLRVLNEVYAVRMYDEGVRRLFMNDYLPTLGQVKGNVTFLTAAGEEKFENIRGFYKLHHNIFTLLVEEHKPEETKEKAE